MNLSRGERREKRRDGTGEMKRDQNKKLDLDGDGEPRHFPIFFSSLSVSFVCPTDRSTREQQSTIAVDQLQRLEDLG